MAPTCGPERQTISPCWTRQPKTLSRSSQQPSLKPWLRTSGALHSIELIRAQTLFKPHPKSNTKSLHVRQRAAFFKLLNPGPYLEPQLSITGVPYLRAGGAAFFTVLHTMQWRRHSGSSSSLSSLILITAESPVKPKGRSDALPVILKGLKLTVPIEHCLSSYKDVVTRCLSSERTTRMLERALSVNPREGVMHCASR